MFKRGTKIDLHKIPFSYKEIFEEMAELIAPYTEKKQLLFNCEIDEKTVPVLLEGDPFKLKLIGMCLLSNAVKFTFSGNVELKAGHKSLGGQRTELQFSVKDTGIGIDKNDLEKVFVPFSIGSNNAETKKYISGGFGLALCKQFVAMLGGEISVISEPGFGSEFKVTIPYNSVNEDLSAHENIPEAKAVDSNKPGVEVFAEGETIAANGVLNEFSSMISSFSPDQLKKIGNNDENFVRTMLEKFISTAYRNVGDMLSALEERDLARLMNVSHKSIPSYHMVALNNVVKDLQCIELKSREGAELSDLSLRVKRVQMETWKAILEIRKYLDSARNMKEEKILY